tara:strand:+ start:226 stop:603 length:378 start_codon:yes stop_codon:yes gene_type:complete
MFELKLNNKTIQLKWGTWAMREFCIAKGITVDKYFDVLANTQFDIDNIIKLVYIGYKSACVSNKQDIEYKEEDACDWIDELGSILATEGQLIDYIKYIVDRTIISVQSNGAKKDEKKKSSKTRLG